MRERKRIFIESSSKTKFFTPLPFFTNWSLNWSSSFSSLVSLLENEAINLNRVDLAYVERYSSWLERLADGWGKKVFRICRERAKFVCSSMSISSNSDTRKNTQEKSVIDKGRVSEYTVKLGYNEQLGTGWICYHFGLKKSFAITECLL